MENVRKHRNIKLLTAERRRIFLVSEPNNHTTVFFTKIVLAKEMRKTQILMNIGFPILDLSKTVMYEFWYATTATSVLIWVGNFCLNLLSPFLSIVCILSSQAISFQILLYALFLWFQAP